MLYSGSITMVLSQGSHDQDNSLIYILTHGLQYKYLFWQQTHWKMDGQTKCKQQQMQISKGTHKTYPSNFVP